ncbi:hypothetical protein KFL01_31220 [Kocuria flava]|uniref:Uncharacterized protein n=1 Tax=Kocuria flava TaxID=446860 RepID=A0ABQ0X892_9MICC|nr:hypothetical protein KFL01_31220 [Kocuria flava]
MNISIRSVWHGGGTSAPSSQARGGSKPEIWGLRATSCVPQRAIGLASRSVKGQVRGRFEGTARPSGTEWHDGPRESIRGTWRAR